MRSTYRTTAGMLCTAPSALSLYQLGMGADASFHEAGSCLIYLKSEVPSTMPYSPCDR